jgi:hypothetical protein
MPIKAWNAEFPTSALSAIGNDVSTAQEPRKQATVLSSARDGRVRVVDDRSHDRTHPIQTSE